MIYVIGKMDLRKKENEIFVEVFSISIKKSSSFNSARVDSGFDKPGNPNCLPTFFRKNTE